MCNSVRLGRFVFRLEKDAVVAGIRLPVVGLERQDRIGNARGICRASRMALVMAAGVALHDRIAGRVGHLVFFRKIWRASSIHGAKFFGSYLGSVIRANHSAKPSDMFLPL